MRNSFLCHFCPLSLWEVARKGGAARTSGTRSKLAVAPLPTRGKGTDPRHPPQPRPPRSRPPPAPSGLRGARGARADPAPWTAPPPRHGHGLLAPPLLRDPGRGWGKGSEGDPRFLRAGTPGRDKFPNRESLGSPRLGAPWAASEGEGWNWDLLGALCCWKMRKGQKSSIPVTLQPALQGVSHAVTPGSGVAQKACPTAPHLGAGMAPGESPGLCAPLPGHL